MDTLRSCQQVWNALRETRLSHFSCIRAYLTCHFTRLRVLGVLYLCRPMGFPEPKKRCGPFSLSVRGWIQTKLKALSLQRGGFFCVKPDLLENWAMKSDQSNGFGTTTPLHVSLRFCENSNSDLFNSGWNHNWQRRQRQRDGVTFEPTSAT